MSRHYIKKIDGKKIKFPSVTTIISDCTDSSGPLTQWAANMTVEYMKENLDPFLEYNGDRWDRHDFVLEQLEKARFNFRKVSQKALDIGSEVHNAIEMLLQGKEFVLTTDRANRAFKAFVEWESEVDLKPIKLEQTVWGSRWAGTLDMVCLLDGVKTVVDFKTSKNFYWDSMGPQIAAYMHAINNKIMFDFSKKNPGMTFIPEDHCVLKCGILRLDKESGMPFYRDRTKFYERDLKIFKHMVDLYFERRPRIRKQMEA